MELNQINHLKVVTALRSRGGDEATSHNGEGVEVVVGGEKPHVPVAGLDRSDAHADGVVRSGVDRVEGRQSRQWI